MRSLLIALTTTILISACGAPKDQQQAAPPDGSVQGDGDAGADSGTPAPDAGSACDGTQPCRISWQNGPAYPADVDHHSTFIATSDAGTFLYVAGGANNQTQGVYDNVRRALINPDGSLGAWVDCSKLPQPNGFQSFAQNGNHVYIMSGITQDPDAGVFGHDFVLEGTVQANGDVSWVKSTHRMRAAFMHGTGAVIGKKVYAIGGLGVMNSPQSLVKVAPINDDGSLGDWATGPSLPLQRSHHVQITYDGQIYLAGGFDTGDVPIADVLRSNFDSNGTLTGWSIVGTMDDSPWTAGATEYRGYIFVIGGGTGGPGAEAFTDRVRRAQITGGGTVTAFEDVDKLPEARSHVHQAPIFGNHIYSVGGRHTLQELSFGDVYIGTIGTGPSM